MKKLFVLMLTIAVCAAMLTACGGPAKDGDGYPNGTLTITVAYSAGGSSDKLARMLQPYLQEELGINVVVENQGGASGQIAAETFLRKEADGYSLLAVNAPGIYYTVALQDTTYDYDDLTPIWVESYDPIVMLALNASPFDSLGDFIEAAKAAPGTYSVGFAAGGKAHRVCAGSGLCRLDKVAQGVKRRGVQREHDNGVVGLHPYGRQIVIVIGGILQGDGIVDPGGVDGQEGIAVRLLPQEGFRRNLTAGAALIFHYDVDAQLFLKIWLEHAGQLVTGASSGIRYCDCQRPVGVAVAVFGRTAAGGQHCRAHSNGQHQNKQLLHVSVFLSYVFIISGLTRCLLRVSSVQ